MRFEGPIRIRPLTVRGVFGISWKLIRRNFGGVFLYTLAMQLILLLVMLAAASPILGAVISGDTENWRFALGIVTAILLVLLVSAGSILLFQPIFTGTLYGEFSSRMYSHGASCGMLFKRGRHSLKRYFTTTLCLLVCMMAVGIVQSIVSGIASGVLGVVSFVSVLPATLGSAAWSSPLDMFSGIGAGVIVFTVLTGVLSMAITLCGQCLVCFVYPVAANEGVFNFDAVGRSIKLVWKRFGRVLGCRALLTLVNMAAQTVLGALLALAIVFSAAPAPPDGFTLAALILLAALSALAMTVAAVLGTLFSIALDTVLYYDARVRLEGRAWLGMDEGEGEGETFREPAEEAHFEAPAEPQNGNDFYGVHTEEKQNGGQDGA